MIGLTPRQKDCVEFIRDYLAENDGVAPSMEEIRLALVLDSKSGAHRLLEQLMAKGIVGKIPNRARSVYLIGDARDPYAPATLKVQPRATLQRLVNDALAALHDLDRRVAAQ